MHLISTGRHDAQAVLCRDSVGKAGKSLTKTRHAQDASVSQEHNWDLAHLDDAPNASCRALQPC